MSSDRDVLDTVRAKGGRHAVPPLSSTIARSVVWGPIVAKGVLAACVLGALGLIGLRAASSAVTGDVATTGDGAATSAAQLTITPAVVTPPSVMRPESAHGTAGVLAPADSAATATPPAPDEPAHTRGRVRLAPGEHVVLNAATEDDLTKLPGVGPVRARAVLALRARMGGRFRAIEDLMRVKGIGRKTLQRIRPLVVLDAPPPAKTEGANTSEGAKPADGAKPAP